MRAVGRLSLAVMAGILMSLDCVDAPAAESMRTLVGTWNGKASGPQGTPPTGDLTVTFKAQGGAVVGRMVVKGQSGTEYSGDVSDISLRKGVFSATATLKLGENPLVVQVTGPLKGRIIEGTFSVSLKGQKMGDGTFSISKAKPAKSAP